MEILCRIKESIVTVWSYIIGHPLESLGLVLAYFSLIVPIRQYLNQRKLEEKDKRFNNYHRLIKELVGPDGPAFIDRQVAVVFELRNYPEYYEVSERIIAGCKQTWGNLGGPVERLIREIDLTTAYINTKK